jgi:hypothetical protein
MQDMSVQVDFDIDRKLLDVLTRLKGVTIPCPIAAHAVKVFAARMR